MKFDYNDLGSNEYQEYMPSEGSVWGFNPPNKTISLTRRLTNDLLISKGHDHRSLGDDDRANIGGDFYAIKRKYTARNTLSGDPDKAFIFAPPGGRYNGLYVSPQYAKHAIFNNDNFPMPSPTSPEKLLSYGREAIAATVPNKPAFAGSQFAAELHEGLPHILPFTRTGRDRSLRAMNAGDAYLNVEFGWKPLLRDYQSFSEAVKKSERIIDDYEKGSGKLIRRSYKWPTEYDVSVTEDTGFTSPLLVNSNVWTDGRFLGDLRTTVTSKTKRWFSAAYMYYFPSQASPERKAAELNKLYGTDITPDTLWNAAPWSWAVDWVTDMGALATNWTAFQTDCLVMPYAYLMEQKTIKVEYQLSGIKYYDVSGYGGNNNGPHTFWQSFETTTKERIAATPYGFYADWEDFSLRQLAILGALGISKGSS